MLSFHPILLVSRDLSVYCGVSVEAFLSASGSCGKQGGPQFCLTLSARLCSDYATSSFPSHLPHPPVACPALSPFFRVPEQNWEQKREGCHL